MYYCKFNMLSFGRVRSYVYGCIIVSSICYHLGECVHMWMYYYIVIWMYYCKFNMLSFGREAFICIWMYYCKFKMLSFGQIRTCLYLYGMYCLAFICIMDGTTRHIIGSWCDKFNMLSFGRKRSYVYGCIII